MATFLLSRLRHPHSIKAIERIACKHGCLFHRSKRNPPVNSWFEGPDLPDSQAAARESAILADLAAANIRYPVYSP